MGWSNDITSELMKKQQGFKLSIGFKIKDACNAESCISGTWLGTEY